MVFFFSSRRRHTRCSRDWSSDVCSSDLFPGVVIISGSGPQDRDGSAVLNIYRQIAEHLSANGVAVLRVDDRGVGKSIPRTGQAYRDFVNDSKAAFEFLLKRPEMDKKKIGFPGDS